MDVTTKYHSEWGNSDPKGHASYVLTNKWCLSQGFTAVNRNHDHGSSYKDDIYLIGAGLQIQRFSPLSSRQGLVSIREGMVQASLSVLYLHPKAASGRMVSRELGWGSSSPHPQWHTYSNRDTPSDTATPWAKHMQTITAGLQVQRFSPLSSW